MYPPTADVAQQAGWSEEWIGTRVSPGPVLAHDLQSGDAPPAVDVVEQAGRSKEWTGTCASCELQPEDAPPTALVEKS